MKKTWQDYYEDAAQQERERIQDMSIDTILENVKNNRYGQYYVVWEIIARKATLKQAGLILHSVLERDINYLIRMNCAEYALLKLMPDCPFSAADIGGTHPEVKENVAKLKELLLKELETN